MASINATTSSGIVATADNTGQLALQANGTTVMTVTSTGVTTQVGAPAFSAYKSASNQSITSAVPTKVTFDTEVFDTNNNFASSTFTPTVAGYYQVSTGFKPEPSSGSPTRTILTFYKNGSLLTVLQDFGFVATNFFPNKLSGSQLIYMNGTTDYLEVYVWIFAGTPVIGFSSSDTWFTGAMVRSA